MCNHTINTKSHHRRSRVDDQTVVKSIPAKSEIDGGEALERLIVIKHAIAYPSKHYISSERPPN